MCVNKCKVCCHISKFNSYYCSKHLASISEENYKSSKYINPEECNDFMGVKRMEILKLNKKLQEIRKEKREILKQEELLVNERQELKDQLKKYKNKLKMYKEL